jgi:hypothetical protein
LQEFLWAFIRSARFCLDYTCVLCCWCCLSHYIHWISVACTTLAKSLFDRLQVLSFVLPRCTVCKWFFRVCWAESFSVITILWTLPWIYLICSCSLNFCPIFCGCSDVWDVRSYRHQLAHGRCLRLFNLQICILW